MTEHLIIHLTDDLVTCIVINDDNQITKTNKTTLPELPICLHNLVKKPNINIDRIIIIPETSNIKTTFLSLTIGPTDNFNDCLVNKLNNNNIPTKNTVIKYKIISANNNEKIEYLLSVLIIPNELYKNITKNISKIKKRKNIQWIPADYCLTLSIIEDKNFSESPLIIHITNTQTNIIIKNNKELEHISSLPFSVEKLKLCLQSDGLSDNQINNKLTFKLTFDKELGFNTRILINDTLSDLQKEIQFICTDNKKSINSALIVTEQLKHTDLDVLIANKLSINCQYANISAESLSSTMLNGFQEKRLISIVNKALELIKDLQIFLTYIPQKSLADLAKAPIITIKKEPLIFFTSLLSILIITFYINSGLNHKLEIAKATLYGIKENVTNTKSQYIDVAESIYKYKKQQILYDRILSLEKENSNINFWLENILSNLPKEITLSETAILLRDKKILITGVTINEKTIYNYLQSLSSLTDGKKVLLKKIKPGQPLGFTIEVQL